MTSDNEFEECSPIMLHAKKRSPTYDPYERLAKEAEISAKQMAFNRVIRLDECFDDLSLKEDYKHGYKPTKYDPDELYKISYWSNEIDEEESFVATNEKNVVFYGIRHYNVFAMSNHISKELPKKAQPMFGEYERFIKSKYLTSKNNDPVRPFVGMRSGASSLVFQSDFECGNLDVAIKKTDKEYDLLMRSDTNRSNKQNWFYFSVENNEPLTVKLNLLNCISNPSLYQQGMRICIKSQNDGNTWGKGGEEITYKVSRISNLEYRRKAIYSLSFTYTFKTAQDKVWFAYAFPYSYTDLWNDLTSIKEDQQKLDNSMIITQKKSMPK